MNARVFLAVAAVLYLLYGIWYFFFPQTLAGIYGSAPLVNSAGALAFLATVAALILAVVLCGASWSWVPSMGQCDERCSRRRPHNTGC